MRLLFKDPFLRAVSVALAMMQLSLSAGEARGETTAFMPSGGVADAPAGFTEMCARDAAHCSVADTAAESAAPSWKSAHGWLNRVNRSVNRAVVQISDLRATGSVEHWNRPGPGRRPVGDCEDIAIEKRARLTQAGFNPGRMFYATAYLRGAGLHTVLIVRLADGDYVLDSLSPHILRWDSSSYIWLRQQDVSDPMRWTTVSKGGWALASSS